MSAKSHTVTQQLLSPSSTPPPRPSSLHIDVGLHVFASFSSLFKSGPKFHVRRPPSPHTPPKFVLFLPCKLTITPLPPVSPLCPPTPTIIFIVITVITCAFKLQSEVNPFAHPRLSGVVSRCSLSSSSHCRNLALCFVPLQNSLALAFHPFLRNVELILNSPFLFSIFLAPQTV